MSKVLKAIEEWDTGKPVIAPIPGSVLDLIDKIEIAEKARIALFEKHLPRINKRMGKVNLPRAAELFEQHGLELKVNSSLGMWASVEVNALEISLLKSVHIELLPALSE